MKRLITIALVVILVMLLALSLVACDNKFDENENSVRTAGRRSLSDTIYGTISYESYEQASVFYNEFVQHNRARFCVPKLANNEYFTTQLYFVRGKLTLAENLKGNSAKYKSCKMGYVFDSRERTGANKYESATGWIRAEGYLYNIRGCSQLFPLRFKKVSQSNNGYRQVDSDNSVYGESAAYVGDYGIIAEYKVYSGLWLVGSVMVTASLDDNGNPTSDIGECLNIVKNAFQQ